MRTSEPIGTKPQARNARSDWALPGATWAQHGSPGASGGQPGADQAAAVAGAAAGRVEQLDGHLAAADEAAADDDEPGVVTVDLDVPAVVARPADAWVVVDVVASRAARGPISPRPTSTTSSEPISPPGPATRRSTSGCDAPP